MRVSPAQGPMSHNLDKSDAPLANSLKLPQSESQVISSSRFILQLRLNRHTHGELGRLRGILGNSVLLLLDIVSRSAFMFHRLGNNFSITYGDCVLHIWIYCISAYLHLKKVLSKKISVKRFLSWHAKQSWTGHSLNYRPIKRQSLSLNPGLCTI